jgi:hypothetical protein
MSFCSTYTYLPKANAVGDSREARVLEATASLLLVLRKAKRGRMEPNSTTERHHRP